jgi:hypothetical protein
MKKNKANLATSARKFPRSMLIVAAIAILALAAMTVVSRQSAGGKQPDAPAKVSPAMPNANNKNATVKVAGQDMPVDTQGQIRPLTPDEAKKMAEGLKGMLNKSSEGLVEEHNADGSVEMDLQGRFQSVTVARINKDGSVTQSCVDNPRAAGAFFGIDPKSIRPARSTSQPNAQ